MRRVSIFHKILEKEDSIVEKPKTVHSHFALSLKPKETLKMQSPSLCSTMRAFSDSSRMFS